jgi:hypothetical protein
VQVEAVLPIRVVVDAPRSLHGQNVGKLGLLLFLLPILNHERQAIAATDYRSCGADLGGPGDVVLAGPDMLESSALKKNAEGNPIRTWSVLFVRRGCGSPSLSQK